ncbi:MAG: class I SAM-dependent methyltransferase [archaeon]
MFHAVKCTKILLWFLARIPTRRLFRDLWINPAEYYVESADNFLARMKAFNVTHKGKKILEIGSGNSFGWGYSFLLNGVGEYTSSDVVRTPSMSKKAIHVEKELIRLVGKRYKSDMLEQSMHFSKHSITSSNKKLRFKQLDITSNHIDRAVSYDVIISNAVFEHIHKDRVDQAIKNMYLLLNINGKMLHHIDLRDHFNMDQKFNFLRYSDRSWSYLTNETHFYTNRLRANDFIELFRKNGFKVTNIRRNIVDVSAEDIRKYAHESFQHYSDEDLKTISFSISLQKQGIRL